MAPNTLDPVTKKPAQADNIVRSRVASEKSHDVNCADESTISHSTDKHASNGDAHQTKEFKPQIRWPDLIAQVFIHAGALYGLYYLIALKAKFYTYVWCKSIKTLQIQAGKSIFIVFQLSCWFMRRAWASQQARDKL